MFVYLVLAAVVQRLELGLLADAADVGDQLEGLEVSGGLGRGLLVELDQEVGLGGLAELGEPRVLDDGLGEPEGGLDPVDGGGLVAELLADGREGGALLLLLLALLVLGRLADGLLLLVGLEDVALDLDGLLVGRLLVAVLNLAVEDQAEGLLEEALLVPPVGDAGHLGLGGQLDLVQGGGGGLDLDVGDDLDLLLLLALLVLLLVLLADAEGEAGLDALLGVAGLDGGLDLDGGGLALVAHLGDGLVDELQVQGAVEALTLGLGALAGGDAVLGLADLLGALNSREIKVEKRPPEGNTECQ